jgi:sec-independent protein translocase protein TatB
VLGVSFSEVVLIAVVALVVVGPRRLPEILGTLGRWVAKLRRMTTEVRRQTGIDEILREEGISGGISELRSIIRGDHLSTINRLAAPLPAGTMPAQSATAAVDAYGEAVEYDQMRERPIEGPDCYGAIPEDLLAGAAPVPPEAVPEPVAELPPAGASPPEAVPAAAPPSPPVPSSPAERAYDGRTTEAKGSA